MALTHEHLRDYLLHADELVVSRAYPRHTASSLCVEHRTMLELLVDAMMKEGRCPSLGDPVSTLRRAGSLRRRAVSAST